VDQYQPFKPRRARIIGIVLGVIVLASMTALAIWVPGAGVLDQVGFAVVGLGIAGLLYRQATVVAVPTANGLRVRNLFLTRKLSWPEIVNVRLGDDPWVQLDLADGDTLSVMAIQRSDGPERVRAEASRLADLVAARS
jgi:hypothetical protein